MSEDAAGAVEGLTRDERWERMMSYWKSLRNEIQVQINQPMTPVAEREVLVWIMSTLDKEVLGVAKLAYEVLNKKDQLTKEK
jgi:hypothetical protein